ncbi:hypothetical protein [Streptomyces apocyni]|uniref:hypothetical protein n=1 Tax=Streptomyces apocyni TaxID=2654677 RepID=UPI0012EAA56F|nr:hypothetical protein [Streptomyces apocyni]
MSDHPRPVPPGTRTGHSQRDGSGNRSVSVSGNTTRIRDSIIAAGSVSVTHIRRNPVRSAVLAAAVTLTYGGYLLLGSETSSADGVDTSVVNEKGLTGASHTVEQLRKAERTGDAEAWCEIAQPSDRSCAGLMRGEFDQRSPENRAQVENVTIGDARERQGGAQAMLGWKGEPQYPLHLAWTNGRWRVDNSSYMLIGLSGGAFLVVVDDHNGERSFGGFPVPSS